MEAGTISIPMGRVGLEFYCTVSGRESKVGKIQLNNKMCVCSEMKGCVGG